MSGGKLVGLAEVMGQARRCGVSSLTIDFSHVDHVDYREITTFMERLDSNVSLGLDMKLVGMNRYLGEIFRAAGVELFEIPGGDEPADCGVAEAAGKDPRQVAAWEAPPRPRGSSRAGAVE